jgi:hypothetical protein
VIALDAHATRFKPYLESLAKAVGLSTAKVGVMMSEEIAEPEMIDGVVNIPLWVIDYPPQLAYSWLHELSHARDFHDDNDEGDDQGEHQAHLTEWSLSDEEIWKIARKSGLWDMTEDSDAA